MPRCSTVCRVAPTSSTPARPSSAPRSRGGSTTRACTSTCAPAASSPSPCGPVCPATGSACTATTSASPRSATALDYGVGRIVVDSFDEIERRRRGRDRARRRRAGPHPRHRRRRGPHARVHRDGARGPEVRASLLAAAHAFEAARRILDAAPSRSRCSGCTATSARRSSTPPGFEVSARRIARPARGSRAGSTASSCPSSTSAAASASPTRPSTTRCRRRTSRPAWPRSSSASAGPSGVAVPRISIEPGRAIAGPSTFTLYEVGTVKPVDLDGGAARAYVSVDGGMSDNVRTALYDANYSCTLAEPGLHGAPVLSRVVGQALRERRHRRQGRVPARRRRARRPARRARHRRLLPVPVEPVQPHAAATGRRRAGRARAGHRPPRDRRRPARPRRLMTLQILRRRCPDRET